MALRAFNTLTARKEDLVPGSRPGEMRIYVCGVTVYDLEPHRPRAGARSSST